MSREYLRRLVLREQRAKSLTIGEGIKDVNDYILPKKILSTSPIAIRQYNHKQTKRNN